MKAGSLKIFPFTVLIGAFFVNSQSPPQLLANVGTQSQKILRPGTSVTLTCPVYGDRDDMMFEWYKDKESLLTFGGNRLRVTGNGSLRIKETVLDDTGVYTCRAVNGFGSVEHNITLVVLGFDKDYEDISEEEDEEEDEEENENFSLYTDESSQKLNSATPPHLLYITEWDQSSIHRVPGSSVRLHCVATGYPKPVVSWHKENDNLPRSAKRGRWSLKLQHLQPPDSGNYICTAKNILGASSHTFYIDVATSPERLRGRPEMTDVHPSNATVEAGQTATLQCIVKSEVTPHIEWLKRVEKSEMYQDEFRNVIEMGNENFRVIKSSEIMARPEGSFLNKLVIPKAEEKDSGKYVCLGTNTNGYSFRSAFLQVLPRPTNALQVDTLPFPIVVAVTVLSFATIAGIVALTIYCRNRGSSRSGDSTTAVPMVTKDAFLPLHKEPLRYAFYDPPRNRSQHQTTIYIPPSSAETDHGNF